MNEDALSIPLAELDHRRAAFVSALDEHDIDVAVLTTAVGIYYLTGMEFGGFATRHALVVRRDGRTTFVVREIEQAWPEAAGGRHGVDEWEFYPDSGDWIDTLAVAVRAHLDPSGRVAAELSRTSLTASEATVLGTLPGVTDLVDATSVIEGLRAVKSTFEVSLMRRAGAATGAGTRAAHDALGAGASDYGATLEAMRAMHEAGSGMITDGPFVVSGAGSTLAHARGSSRRPTRGELASTMMTSSIGRYQCPLERTFAIGEADGRAADLLHLAAAATEHVIATIGPGMTSGQADGVARDFWRTRGLEDGFVHRLAYSIGIAYPPLWWENEVMQLRPDDERVVRPGMTFHLVPGIHVDGLGFVNQSMTVAITEDGCEPLADLELVLDPA